jgi:hypothetical protein
VIVGTQKVGGKRGIVQTTCKIFFFWGAKKIRGMEREGQESAKVPSEFKRRFKRSF